MHPHNSIFCLLYRPLLNLLSAKFGDIKRGAVKVGGQLERRHTILKFDTKMPRRDGTTTARIELKVFSCGRKLVLSGKRNPCPLTGECARTRRSHPSVPGWNLKRTSTTCITIRSARTYRGPHRRNCEAGSSAPTCVSYMRHRGGVRRSHFQWVGATSSACGDSNTALMLSPVLTYAPA